MNKELVIIIEDLRRPMTDFQNGEHGIVPADQKAYNSNENMSDIDIIYVSEKQAGVYMRNETIQQSDNILTDMVKGGEIFHGKKR